MSKNSQFEVCSTVPLDIHGSLAGILDFGEDIVSKAGSDSGGISLHGGSKSDTDSDYNMEPSILSAISSSFNRKGLFLFFIQEIVIVKFIIIIKRLGTIFEYCIICMSTNATMLNEYSFLERTYGLELKRIYVP